MERVLNTLKNLEHWVADKVLNTLFVLQTGEVASFATATFASPTRPSGLRNPTLQLSIASVHVDGSNIQFHRQRQDVDERQNIGFVVDQFDIAEAFLESLSDFFDQSGLEGI